MKEIFRILEFQYRKRYVRVATVSGRSWVLPSNILFQYRKRYVRVATLISIMLLQTSPTCSFNTASGMYALQQRVWKSAPRQG